MPDVAGYRINPECTHIHDFSTMVTEHNPDAYPQPHFPILPVFSWHNLTTRSTRKVPSVLDATGRVEVQGGTEAIALALQSLGTGESDSVLLPSFHCYSMVEPVLAVGAQPVFYKIKPDLSVDLDDIESKITGNTRVLLFAHYFGFPQNVPGLKQLAERNSIRLIEDCAHAYYGEFHGKSAGCHGDLAIASVRKFFPVTEGGYLLSNSVDLSNIKLRGCGTLHNIKAVVNLVEEALHYNRLGPVGKLISIPLDIKNLLWSGMKSLRPKLRQTTVDSTAIQKTNQFNYLDPDTTDTEVALVTRLVSKRCNPEIIMQRRRANYSRLADELAGLGEGYPLFPALPEGVTPYMFPFVLKDHSRTFPLLKHQGLPIFRWEDVEKTDCTVSTEYSMNLLQLPCHQELTEGEITWMIRTIRAALAH